jgi:SAM-dependent methyltransferase
LDALSLPELGKVFDNALDCGLFHGFADDDRQRYVAALATAIKPGGHLFLLCFSDQEPGTEGPRRVSQAELRAAFATGWTIESIAAFRFDVVSDYQPRFSPGGPKAWLAVIRRD